MLLYKSLHNSKLFACKSMILRKLKLWFKPEFGFSDGAVHMNMHSWFFTGEEKESKTLLTENSRTHTRYSFTSFNC